MNAVNSFYAKTKDLFALFPKTVQGFRQFDAQSVFTMQIRKKIYA